jgi:hypothetical protein
MFSTSKRRNSSSYLHQKDEWALPGNLHSRESVSVIHFIFSVIRVSEAWHGRCTEASRHRRNEGMRKSVHVQGPGEVSPVFVVRTPSTLLQLLGLSEQNRVFQQRYSGHGTDSHSLASSGYIPFFCIVPCLLTSVRFQTRLIPKWYLRLENEPSSNEVLMEPR